jgi:hypothetical protein
MSLFSCRINKQPGRESFASFDHLLYRKTFVRKQGAAALPNAPVIAGSGFSLPHVQ